MALKLGDLSKVPAKQKIFLVVLVCLLMAAGYYYLYYSAAAIRIADLEKKLGDLEHEIKQQEVIARNLPAFKAEVRRLEEQLGILLEQLPNSAEIPSLLKNITDLGKESGLEFLKFTPSAEVRKDFYAEIPVSIQVSGDYHSFVLFADKVSHLPRIVNISDIGFAAPTRSGDDRVLVNVGCTATTYRFLEQAPQAAAGGSAGTGKGTAK
ncbi:MAG: type 4a pilus biogenesis protein PilO [Deltaproteobacteria bacterium]|nr:type 4a pilus biogenesis protein PilO [Deltaproteobacteria bacterium]